MGVSLNNLMANVPVNCAATSTTPAPYMATMAVSAPYAASMTTRALYYALMTTSARYAAPVAASNLVAAAVLLVLLSRLNLFKPALTSTIIRQNYKLDKLIDYFWHSVSDSFVE